MLKINCEVKVNFVCFYFLFKLRLSRKHNLQSIMQFITFYDKLRLLCFQFEVKKKNLTHTESNWTYEQNQYFRIVLNRNCQINCLNFKKRMRQTKS